MLSHVLAQVGPGALVAAVGHENRVDLAGVSEESLSLRQRKQHSFVVSRKTSVGRYRNDVQVIGAILEEHRKRVADRRLQRLCGLLVYEHAIAGKCGDVQRPAIGVQDRSKDSQVGGIYAGDINPANTLAGFGVRHGGALGDYRHQPVDPVVVRKLGAQVFQSAGWEVRTAARQTERVADGGCEDLVDLPESLGDLVSDRVVDRVPGAQGGGDYQRAEHQAHDDERGLRGPSGDVAQADFQDDAVQQCKEADPADNQGEADGHSHHDPVGIYSENLFHS